VGSAPPAPASESGRFVGQPHEELTVLAETSAIVHENGERVWGVELYRLKGELTLQSKVESAKWKAGKQRSKSKSQKVKGKSRGWQYCSAQILTIHYIC
jgi:hypothetical protein